jgi:predicted transposase YdaD
MILASSDGRARKAFMVEKQEPKLYQQQVYDSTFKSLLEDQPQEMLSLLVEGMEYVHELSESAQKPSLRVDRVYQVLYLSMLHILHIEFETDAHSEMPLRMLEYYGICTESIRSRSSHW